MSAVAKRVHIVGCPRSGTTLMLGLIASCFEVDGACELEMSLHREPERPCAVFVSKKPTDVRILAPILRADPDLFAVYLVRDPRAVISSLHPGFPGRWFVTLSAWHECERHARALAGEPRFVTVRYEDLVADPDGVQDALAVALPFLRRRHRFSEFARVAAVSADAARVMHGVRAVSADRVDGWRAHLARIRAQEIVHGGLGPALVERGYERDEAWLAALAGVEPDFGPSRFADREPVWKVLDRRWRDWWRTRRTLRRVRARVRAESAAR